MSLNSLKQLLCSLEGQQEASSRSKMLLYGVAGKIRSALPVLVVQSHVLCPGRQVLKNHGCLQIWRF